MPACLRFLLVDDNIVTRFLQQRLLAQLKGTAWVATAESGLDALALLPPQADAAACPDIILLDLQMPDRDGMAFLEHYQRLLPLPRPVSVFALSIATAVSLSDLERLQGLPVSGFLNKPLTPADVDYVLHMHAQRARLPAFPSNANKRVNE